MVENAAGLRFWQRETRRKVGDRRREPRVAELVGDGRKQPADRYREDPPWDLHKVGRQVTPRPGSHVTSRPELVCHVRREPGAGQSRDQ